MGKPLHALIIEDSEDDALLILRALRKEGYDPHPLRVETGEAMRAALQDQNWDVILCDYKLPAFGGEPAIALLKELNLHIPLIIVSGAIGEETAVACMRAGARDYISKDNLSRLFPVIERELAEVASDIERRRAELAFLNSEFRLKALFEHMSSSVAVYEAVGNAVDFILKDFNPAAETAEKKDRTDAVGTSILELFPHVRESGIFEALQRVWKTGQSEEIPPFYWREDGTQGWRAYHIYKLPTGQVVTLYNDITASKKAEIKIAESEEKYRLLVENSSEAILIAQKGQLKFVNRAVVNMFGVSYERMTSAPFSSFIHPEDREQVVTYHLQRLRGETVPDRYTFRVITKTGVVRWMEIRPTVVSWEGKPATLNFITDITEQNQAAEKLKESEEKYRSLFEQSRDCIYIIDLAGKFVDANPQALELMEYDRADIPTLNILSLLDESALTNGVREFEEIVQTGLQNVLGEHALRSKSGKLILVETQASLIRRKGEPHLILGIARDITERKRIERALKESEKKHRELIDFLPISLFEMDLQGNVTSANPAVFELFGYAPSDLEKNLNAVQMIVPDDLERFLKNRQKLLSGEKKGTSEYTGLKKDGSAFPFLVFSSLIVHDGRPTGIRGAIVDLTESKQAQEKLQKSEEKYRSILAGIEEGYFEVDLTGHFTFFNESLCRMYGYSREELPGLHYSRYVDKANAEKLSTVFNTMYKTGSPSTRYSYELIRKDGVKRYMEASATLIKDVQGKISGFRGIVRDVTEHREMEAAIWQSEEKYRTIIEQMEDGYFEVDVNGHFTFVNDAQCRILGYTREEMIGMHNRQYVAQERRKELYALFGKIHATGIPVKSYDLELVKKDGTKSYSEISVSLIRNAEGTPAGFRGISRDVTERRRAEIKLRNYAEEISDLYNNAPCGYHSLGPDGSFLLINNTELTWLGYDRDEIIGRKKWPELLTPESRARFREIFPVFKEQGFVSDIEFDVIRKDGSIFSALLNATAIKDQNGHFLQSRSTLFDVTPLKKVQQELNEKNLELTRTYEDLREKQAMIIQQEKMASIGMLAAGVAHEIKNPLAIILQGIDYLQTTLTDDVLLTEVIGRLNMAVLRADTIVKGLLSYARQSHVSLVKQDILTLIDESLVLTEHEFRSKNIRLIKKYPSHVPRIPLDGNQIKQVFVNLIINGIDAMCTKGTLTVTIERLKDDADKDILQISFRDTGHGIPADKIKKIFDPFYTTKPLGSTGLGLSISKGIIDMHEGIIYAESQNEQGANFIIKLPVRS